MSLEAEAKSENFAISEVSMTALTSRMPYISDTKERLRLKKRMKILSEYNITKDQLSRIRDRLSIRTESEMMGTMKSGSVEAVVTNENLVDNAGSDFTTASAGKSLESQQGQQGTLSMANFLNRPIQIHEDSVAVGANLELRLSVWELFTSIPSVRAKLRNFAFLRGNLHVRVSVSGSPFHAGRLLVSYQPLSDVNTVLAASLTNYGLASGYRTNLLSYLSQAPGAAYINVNQNSPLDLELPYISPKPMHRLFNTSTSAIGAATALDDFADAGDLFIYSMVPISAVSATASPVSIQVYAWMESVELGTVTATQLAITTESEIKQGPIERIASRLHTVSNEVASIPVLGPYASVASSISGTIARVAAILGWSKPPYEGAMNRIPMRTFTDHAICIGRSTAERLVMDPLQEVSIDPSVCGSTTDDMQVAEIARRKSFYTTFTWQEADGLLDNIFTTGITPMLSSSYVATEVTTQLSASAFAALPFSYWRGDVTLTFDIICSQFHRGKLAVYFEPNVPQGSLINASLSLNKQFIQIIDIQDTQTFSVTIKWASPLAWLKTMTAQTAYYAAVNPLSSSFDQGFYNGYIGVMPFTALQSPDSSDVIVLVSVSVDDLQVNGPRPYNLNSGRAILTESDVVTRAGITDTEVSKLVLNESTATTDTICTQYFGEQPLSFRSLIKRYESVIEKDSTGSGGATSLQTTSSTLYPNDALPYSTSTAKGVVTLFEYLRYAYLGVKGGYRYRVITNIASTIQFARANLADITATNATLSNVLSSSSVTGGGGTFIGSALMSSSNNQTMEFEFPFFTSNLFVCAFDPNFDCNASDDGFQERTWFRNWTFFRRFGASVSSLPINLDGAAADDFSFMRFQGAIYVSGNPVA